MPAHEHLQNQLFTGQGYVDAQRRKRLLASSQRAIEDSDFAVDNKAYPKNEALEASDLKRWGPDPDPVDPANPTIFRFNTGFHPQINNNFYRSPEEEGSGPAEYTLPNNDRGDRAEVFGSTDFVPYRPYELDRDEDGPLHGLAQPTNQDEGNYFANSTKAHMYMSKKEKAVTRQKEYADVMAAAELRNQENTSSLRTRAAELRREEYERDQDVINNPNLVPTSEHTRRLYPDGNYGRD